MIKAENIREAEQRRLTWRCRRGMLELDIVLQKFVEQHFNQLTMSELQAFDEMLGLPDNEFWSLVSNVNKSHKDTSLQSLLCKMRVL